VDGLWQEFSTTWNSGSSTSLTINIIDTNLADVGSDFAMDDISLNPLGSPAAAPESGSAVLLLTGAFGFIRYGWRRRRLTFARAY
jgi:hypothetical protein